MNSAGKAQQLRASKGRQRIAALTAYDYPMARLLDDAGMDVLLVGDSLGMVVLGFPDTTHVTLEHMMHHTAAVARANPRAMVLGDLPIHTYDDPDHALISARQLITAGAVKSVKQTGHDSLAYDLIFVSIDFNLSSNDAIFSFNFLINTSCVLASSTNLSV